MTRKYEGEPTSYVHPGVEVLGFWNKCLEGDEVAAAYNACKDDESTLSAAFHLWVQGKDNEAKALIPEEDHVLLEGLIMWGGVSRKADDDPR